MQRGQKCNEGRNATKAEMQRGQKCNEGRNATRAEMQRGQKCNEGRNATRAEMQRVPGSLLARTTHSQRSLGVEVVTASR